MAVDATRLPDHIETRCIGTPVPATIVHRGYSGDTVRIIKRQFIPWRWEVAYGPEWVNDILAIQLCHYGAAYPVRFKPPRGFRGEGVSLGFGDGSETEFQLKLVWATAGGRTYERNVYAVDDDSLVVYVDGVEVDPADYTLNSVGVIVFDNPVAYTAEVTADFDALAAVIIAEDEIEIEEITLDEDQPHDASGVAHRNLGHIATLVLEEVDEFV